jgi:hypothetical protein
MNKIKLIMNQQIKNYKNRRNIIIIKFLKSHDSFNNNIQKSEKNYNKID